MPGHTECKDCSKLAPKRQRLEEQPPTEQPKPLGMIQTSEQRELAKLKMEREALIRENLKCQERINELEKNIKEKNQISD